MIRETLYDEIPLPRRSRLHRQVARAIEQLALERPRAPAAGPGPPPRRGLAGGDAARARGRAQAAERADAVLAHEEAARYYRLALQAVEHGSARGGLLAALGEALALAGEYLQAREAFEEVAAIARGAHEAGLLARAALGFEQASWRPGLPGLQAARLLREALDLQPSGDSALKAQLLSSLARALIFSGEDAQAVRVEQQAVAMARRSGDTPALIATLLATASARWQPERSAERLRNIDEAARLAQDSGDALREIEALSWRLFELMEHGDPQAWLALLVLYERRAAEMRQPFFQYIAATARAAHALFEGRYAEAEGLIRHALQLGRRMPGLDASGVYGVQMFELQREQGRLVALAPLLRRWVEAMPGTGIWRPGLALIYAEIGQLDAARAEFELWPPTTSAASAWRGRAGPRAWPTSRRCAATSNAKRAAVLPPAAALRRRQPALRQQPITCWRSRRLARPAGGDATALERCRAALRSRARLEPAPGCAAGAGAQPLPFCGDAHRAQRHRRCGSGAHLADRGPARSGPARHAGAARTHRPGRAGARRAASLDRATRGLPGWPSAPREAPSSRRRPPVAAATARLPRSSSSARTPSPTMCARSLPRPAR